MDVLRVLFSRIRAAFGVGRRDTELDEEIRAHLDLLAAEHVRRGMTPGQARLAARRDFGGIEQMKERYRDQRGVRALQDLRRDTVYALRTLGRNPGFTLVSVLTLALGIGATTAIFSVVHAVLLQPLPYATPGRLVHIVENVPASESVRGVAMRLSSMNQDEFSWWRTRTTTLSHMAASQAEARTMRTPAGTVRLSGARVSPALFPMLGVPPLLGRWLTADEERPDADTVVLSAAAWQRYFGADPNVLSRTMVLDGRVHAIVGVMPGGFDFPARHTEIWTPYVLEPRRENATAVIAVTSRLQDGVSIETAMAEANVLGHQLRGIPPESDSPARFEVVRVQDQLAAPVRPALRVLMVSAGLVLLLVCANLANLLLARGATRAREMAIRRALGAARGRIVRQLLTESVVLSLAGGLAGAALAFGGVWLVRTLAIVEAVGPFRVAEAILPRLDEVAVDAGVFAFACGLSVLTGVLYGVAPALRMSGIGAAQVTGDSGLAAVAGASARRQNRTGRVLGIAQVVLATTLLVGAGLLMHSFARLANVHAGYEPGNVLHFQLVLPQQYSAEQKMAIAHDLAARLRSLPRVGSAGFTNIPPLSELSIGGSLLPSGVYQPGMTRDQFPQIRTVSPDYLPAIGARLLEGRWFAEDDGPGQREVVLVNRAYSRRYFGEHGAIGAVLGDGARPSEIIGVVEDIRLRRLDAEPELAVFQDMRQALAGAPSDMRQLQETVVSGPSGAMSFAVRGDGDPLSIVPDVRALVQQVDPAAALEGLMPMSRLASGSLARPRFYAVVVGVFAGVAALLAVIGIYGVLAYSVSQRTQEIGVRLALGAAPRAVLALVFRQGGAMVAIGIVLGIAGAAGMTRVLDGMLFGLTPLDPATYVAVAVAFAAAAMVACYVPARRAMRVDPLVAIRHD